MRVIEEDLKRGTVKLLIETIDDLWVLFNVIKEGDVVYAKTTREVKFGDGSEGSRLSMTLGVKVQRVEFHQFGENLRVGGLIVDGPEKFGVKGKHHTLSLGVGDIITVIKEEWEPTELEFIKRFATRRDPILLVAIDYDEVCIGVLREQGIKYLWEESLNLPSKVYQTDYTALIRGFIERALAVTLEVARRENIRALVVVGPGEVRDSLKSELQGKVSVPVFSDYTSSGGCQGVKEALRRDIVREAIGGLNIIRAKDLIEEFKRLVVEDQDLVAYGIDEVHYVSLIGAIKCLLVADELLKDPDDSRRGLVLSALRNAYRQGAEIMVVPARSDVGVELLGFGGIIAILRFKLHKA